MDGETARTAAAGKALVLNRMASSPLSPGLFCRFPRPDPRIERSWYRPDHLRIKM
jgi:hypothetical protein